MNSPSVTTRNEAAGITAYIGLGANLESIAGSPQQTLSYAAERLAQFSEGGFRLSRIYSSTPQDCPPGSPSFCNAVAELHLAVGTTPEFLLSELQSLEYELGRVRSGIPNEARALDLDLLTFGDIELFCEDLVLPHPRAHQRGFVLAPLAELAPDLLLPGQTRTVRELLSDLPEDPLLIPLGMQKSI
ncbi:MAG: 2-amino-4-hydroxy-6-hydroxymethyldihydropteridine diphosphokinase [Proteobacteria bacterium]|nr:2-amino-4-hydroxy-6-hydroxymethyldihydropteridine diphosphokinase [Pseudomonadota bacterium]MDA0926549.1 2-amino-4-hydroxy-6-hydroxymethyldihydropteridine diphosphokinase [Pseudomonadota bacterium]